MLKRLLIAIVVVVPCLLLAAKQLSQSDEQATRRVLEVQAMSVDLTWTGTGFLVNTPDGLRVMTNRHVCMGAVTIQLKLNGDKLFRPAHITKVSNTTSDLCLLIPDKSLDVSAGGYELASDMGTLPLEVTVYGYPHSRPLAYYPAKLISTERIHSVPNDSFNGMLVSKLSTPTVPGSSGSPVLNGKGQLVAVICGLQRSTDGAVKGLAVPLSSIKQFLFSEVSK